MRERLHFGTGHERRERDPGAGRRSRGSGSGSTRGLSRTHTLLAESGGGARFDELFYMIHTVRSGRHHADGVLWVRNGRHEVVAEKVPLTDVAPTLLAHFGVAQPDYMGGRPLLV